MNRLIAAGVVLVVVLYVLFSSLYVVNPREQAIVTRFGQITDVKAEPGLYFKLPTSLVDNVQIVENRLLRYDTRGHGKSEVTQAPYSMEQLADDIAGPLDTLGIRKTHFVGLAA